MDLTCQVHVWFMCLMNMKKQIILGCGQTPEEVFDQEKALCFPSFKQEDAIGLAHLMMESMATGAGPFAVIIELNGVRVFQYVPPRTGPYNLLWMERKLFTVKVMEKSTMRVRAEEESKGHDLKLDALAPESELIACGGGFPIVVNGVGMVGQIAVSGPAGDRAEHNFIVESLQKYQCSMLASAI